MQPISTIEIIPSLPTKLENLRELAYNLRWTWEHEIINLFRELDDELWEKTGHNPVLMLGAISQDRLNVLESDANYMSRLDAIYQKHCQYMKGENTWYQRQFGLSDKNTIAYFSAEFGLTECLPIYSGGLGILAGDHIKASSELGIPLVGVGIVYQQGYFRQYLNPDGWQQERYPLNDFYNMPIVQVKDQNNKPLLISIDFPGRKVYAQIWKAQVGRVTLYLLDTNIDEHLNIGSDEDITDALYHGDSELRIQQEIILGIGGMRALNAVGINPTVCHMNEGHSAFLGLERIRMLINNNGLSFGEAKEVAAAGQIFTTHTAVPAGIDKFTPELVEKYFSNYYQTLGLNQEEFLALGRTNRNDGKELFSMANLAIRLSSKVNAVSKLHDEVSKKLFGDVWKDIPESEVPISYVTNGIHVRSWISQEMSNLYDQYLGPKWPESIDDSHMWKHIENIPDEELWWIHQGRRERLVEFCRNRVKQQLEARGALAPEIKETANLLDPDILTIGFARRVATYKRATLLLHDPEKLAAILTNKDYPVQIIIAGKAHPEDIPAKELIRQLIHFARLPEVRNRVVFIEDYDMNIARRLVQGVDIWLNTPRRFLEACGTSGMKVSFNGGINVSVLDGWWDEAYKADVGWAIGQGEVYDDAQYQDNVESNALYDLLTKEIIPLFYERSKDGKPKGWISRMKSSMLEICPAFNVNRMLHQYTTDSYVPALRRYNQFLEDGSKIARNLSSWRDKLYKAWQEVKIISVQSDIGSKAKVGDETKVTAQISLGSLSSEDVSVQIYHGQIDLEGKIRKAAIVPMSVIEKQTSDITLFTGTIHYDASGRHGFTVRVVPQNKYQMTSFDTGLILWAS